MLPLTCHLSEREKRDSDRERNREMERNGGERRRRIMERGTDRMAVITGGRDQTSSVGDNSMDQSPALLFPHQPIHVIGRDHIHHIHGKQQTSLNNYGIDLSPKHINSCIIDSQNMRVLCSVVIALLVVLSNVSLPRSIVKSESIIASKPLYVLLMTDVAIVIARLALGNSQQPGLGLVQENHQEEEKENQQKRVRGKCQENWDVAVKLLEIGLVVYQTLRAIFIDCSFYMVIVICGLCLL